MNNLRPPRAEQPALAVDPRHLAFGEVWETDRFEWTVPVRNTGRERLELTNLSGSCNCGSVELPALTLQPGETQNVRLTFDLRSNASTQTSWEFAAGVSGTAKAANGKAVPVSWTVRGRVKHLLQSPPTVDFGTISELAAPFAPLVVPFKAHADVTNVSVACSLPEFRPEVRTAPTGYELVLTPPRELKRGPLSGTITFTASTKSGSLVPAVRPLVGEVVPDVEAIPAFVQGARETGEELVEPLTLRSRTNRPFTVERATSDSAAVRASGAGSAWTLRVRMPAGPLATKVRFRVRTEGAPPFEVEVPVTVHGFSPESKERR